MNLVKFFVIFISLSIRASTSLKVTVTFTEKEVRCQSINWLEVSVDHLVTKMLQLNFECFEF
jgi:hypothetical protein